MSIQPSPDGGISRAAAAAAVAVVALANGADADEVHVSADVARTIGVHADGDVIVKAGGNSAPAVMRIVAPGTSVRLAPALTNRLAVAPGLPLHVTYDAPSNTLSLGPFVGILALRSRRGAMYGEHELFFQALTRQGRNLAVPAFMFSPRDVRWQQGRINGYVMSSSGKGRTWRRLAFPLPDVVYDRIQTRRAEAGPGYATFRRRLRTHVRAWFNEHGFFDKWRLHALLWENERLRPLLPETRRYLGVGDVEHMLQSYPRAYVKPVAGSLGLGIMRVRRSAGSGLAVTYEVGERAITRHRKSAAGLHRLMSHMIRGQPYIVQQGLPLATWHGRPFDVRILVQRTAGGEWAVTKMFARVAALGGITSNLTRGAEACNIHLLLRSVFGRRRGQLYRQLHAAGLHCAEEIAATLPGLVGELGLDLGLSRNGRIWLIEANSKPFLQMTRESGSARTLALSVRRPLQFAKHLAGC